MASLRRLQPQFEALDAQVVGISTDSPYSHIGWQEHQVGELGFPLLCDFYPHGRVAELYGVLRTEPMPLPGINQRTVFVVSKAGTIVFAKQYALSDQPDPYEVLACLEQLQTETQAAVP